LLAVAVELLMVAVALVIIMEPLEQIAYFQPLHQQVVDTAQSLQQALLVVLADLEVALEEVVQQQILVELAHQGKVMLVVLVLEALNTAEAVAAVQVQSVQMELQRLVVTAVTV
jgi:hypothetical protein